jgi:predicted RNA-binding protein with PIN domain
MSYSRILVDGYSVTHAWADLAKLQRKNFAAARDALIRKLSDYAAHSGQSVTIVFDAMRQKQSVPQLSTPHCEVLFSPHGETADSVIERYCANVADPSRVLVVTDDHAERTTVESFGAVSQSAELFQRIVEEELGELQGDIRRAKKTSSARFRRGVL